jgi:hypothetical protein
MSAILHAPALGWVRAHRAAIVILVLELALAATLGVLAARLVSGPGPAPATSVSNVHLQPTDNGCQLARPGQPC